MTRVRRMVAATAAIALLALASIALATPAQAADDGVTGLLSKASEGLSVLLVKAGASSKDLLRSR
ncbi:hypothetical protein [Streptomyces sp. NPDC037389]|uniref:hypothetical protein n=1 Tax=Streptomyces sp. NPDC037389 TaxID=3155369 RepID=UPI0033EEA259